MKTGGILKIAALFGALAAVSFWVLDSSKPSGHEHQLDDGNDPLVVFVLIDTLRRDHVAAFGHSRPTTPNMDRLAKEGFVANGMLVHASQTVPSVSSMFTSTLPSQHGVQFEGSTQGFGNQGESKKPLLLEDNLTLAEVLQDDGYFTAANVTNPWLRGQFGFGQGFDEFQAVPFLDDRRGVANGATVNEFASAQMQAHSEGKTFLYLHYMDVHNPYAHDDQLPRVFRAAEGNMVYTNGPIEGVSEDDLAYSMDAYDDGIVYMDSLIGELAKQLEEAAETRDVLMVITSDHGDEFLEHGGMGHGSTLYPELIESFAIFWRPNARLARATHTELSGAIDIAPTILDLLGIGKPDAMTGRSLLRPTEEGRAVISELASKKAAIKDGWGVVRDLKTESEEVVAYAGNGDAEPSPALLTELRSLLDGLELRETPIDDTVMIPALEQQLKALGYVE